MPPPATSSTALPFARDLTIVLDARRCGGEEETVLAVEVRVEDEEQRVRIRRVRVAAGLTIHDPIRLPIEEPGAHIDLVVVVHDTHFGALADRLALKRISLQESIE